MQVLMVNGSPHEKGCTYTALTEIAATLETEGIESEVFQLGTEPLAGCIACGHCAREGVCIFDDKVNEFLEIAGDADGFIFGSPVHYAAATGAITSFMDRAFYTNLRSGGGRFYLKPAACVVSARRAGTTATFDQLIKYFTISEMPVISSRYWNMVHGATPDQVKQDVEGLQTMRILARNMAWFLRCKEAGTRAWVPLPEREQITPHQLYPVSPRGISPRALITAQQARGRSRGMGSSSQKRHQLATSGTSKAPRSCLSNSLASYYSS